MPVAVVKHANNIEKKTSYQITRELIQSKFELSVGEKLILVILASRMNKKLQCYPSYRSLAENAGCSKRSIGTYIQNLIEKDYIKIVDSEYRSNTYTYGEKFLVEIYDAAHCKKKK